MEVNVSINGQAAVLNVLRAVIENHQQALADAMGVESPNTAEELSSIIINNVREMTPPAIQLPPVLSRTMRNSQAFSKAVEMGYIRTSAVEGQLEWTLGNKTLLAYFCGRLWCNDCSQVIKVEHKTKALWHQGKTEFPAAALKKLFKELNLKQLRLNRSGCGLPKHYELIDELFEVF